MVDGSPAASLPVTATVTIPGKSSMKKTALSNNDGLIPLTFDIPADAQTLQVVVRKTQTFMFKSTLLRRALETIANVCEAVLFSL